VAALIVARVETDSMDRLRDVITWKVRILDKIESTLTKIVQDSRNHFEALESIRESFREISADAERHVDLQELSKE
jgi:hypothetical protein